MSTGTYCETCRKYIDLPEQPVDEKWRCLCDKPAPSDGRIMPRKKASSSGTAPARVGRTAEAGHSAPTTTGEKHGG